VPGPSPPPPPLTLLRLGPNPFPFLSPSGRSCLPFLRVDPLLVQRPPFTGKTNSGSGNIPLFRFHAIYNVFSPSPRPLLGLPCFKPPISRCSSSPLFPLRPPPSYCLTPFTTFPVFFVRSVESIRRSRPLVFPLPPCCRVAGTPLPQIEKASMRIS